MIYYSRYFVILLFFIFIGLVIIFFDVWLDFFAVLLLYTSVCLYGFEEHSISRSTFSSVPPPNTRD